MAKAKSNDGTTFSLKGESNQQFKPVSYSVRRIKSLASLTDEFKFQSANRDFIVKYKQRFGHNGQGFIDFTLRAYFEYNNKPEETFLSIDVQTVFEVENWNQFVVDDNILDFPPEFLVTIISISVSHTRALLAAQTAGTLYGDMVLPIVNAIDMAKSFGLIK